MRFSPYFILIATSVVAVEVAAICFCSSQAISDEHESTHPAVMDHTSHANASSQEFGFVGSGSCNSAGCHGKRNDEATYPVGREHSIWIQEDPHAKAYTVLLEPKSQQIAKNLGIEKAHEAKVCLDCHSINATSHPEHGEFRLASGAKHTIVDGVGCESCHGAAEKWLDLHTQNSWKYMTAADKSVYGFSDTANLYTRGKTCAKCHIGDTNKDMNHDLIAAGHPRLYFELSAYQNLMPRHWQRSKDKSQNGADLEAKLWVVGQLTSFIKKLDLLEKRAADEKAPWPEFSEYGCFECHHNLNKDREQRVSDGKLKWASWHGPMFEQVIKTIPELSASGHMTSYVNMDTYSALHDEMKKPLPKRAEVIRLSSTLRQELDRFANNFAGSYLSENDLKKMLDVASNVNYDSNPNWDKLTQRYLGTAAVRLGILESSPGVFPQSAESSALLKELGGQLRFESNYDSPVDYSRKDQEAFAEDMKELRKFLGLSNQTEPATETSAPAIE